MLANLLSFQIYLWLVCICQSLFLQLTFVMTFVHGYTLNIHLHGGVNGSTLACGDASHATDLGTNPV